MVDKYKVITLCGSTRFKDEFMEAQKRLTLEGNIVISVGLFGHLGDKEVWGNMDEGTLTATKEMLDDMHKRKIDMADGIFVINVGGYVGESTRSEIEYAKSNGKTVHYLEETSPEHIYEVLKGLADGKDPLTRENLSIDKFENKESIQAIIKELARKYEAKTVDDTNLTHKKELDTKTSEGNLTDVEIQRLLTKVAILCRGNEDDKKEALQILIAVKKQVKTYQQLSLLVPQMIAYYIMTEDYSKADKLYRDADKRYGMKVINSQTLAKLGRQLYESGNLLQAQIYLTRAKEKWPVTNKDEINGLLELIRQQKSEGRAGKNRGYKMASDSLMKETQERSCYNCKHYRNENCAGLDGLCKDYQYVPTTSKEELESWPTEMGPYVTGYKPKRR